VVYTKTIIHLSVGESDGYLPPLRSIIVNYCWRLPPLFVVLFIHSAERSEIG